MDELNTDFVSQQEYNIIREWHDRLDKYEEPNDDPYSHKAILEDSKWLEIVETGKKCKKQSFANFKSSRTRTFSIK